MDVFAFGWRENIGFRVAVFLIMASINAVDHGRSDTDNNALFSPITQLSLHPGSEWLDYFVVIPVTNTPRLRRGP